MTDESDYIYVTVYLMKGAALAYARYVMSDSDGIKVFHGGVSVFVPWSNVAKVVEHG